MHFHLPKPLHGWRAFVGEVAIIVLGILIALGAEQLVQWVHWRDKQHEMLERLLEESRYNVGQLKELQRTDEDVQREIRFAADLTRRQSCPPPPEWGAISSVTSYPEVGTSTSTYDEIIGSGGLSDIASSQVRDGVAWFHFRLGLLQRQTDYFRSIHGQLLTADDGRIRLSYDPPDRSAIAGIDREALCRDPTFRNRVMLSAIDHVKWNDRIRALTEIPIRVCGELGRVLGEPCTPAVGAPLTAAERKMAVEALDSEGQH